MKYYFTFYVDNLLINNQYKFAQSKLFQSHTEKTLKLYELCFNSFLQHSTKESYILVDEASLNYIKKYTNISDKYLIKHNFNHKDQYKQVWSLNKIEAYKYICNIGDPFAFFDLDMIMVEDVYDIFLLKDIFIHEFTPNHQLPDWHLNSYVEYVKNNSNINDKVKLLLEKINYNFDKIKIPNCAVFGGTDLNKINNYIEIVSNHCFSIQNYNYWSDNNLDSNGFTKACILEQFLLGLINWDPVKNETNLFSLKKAYSKHKSLFPVHHISQDKYYLYDISSEDLYNTIFKIFKKYTRHHLHLKTLSEGELLELNLTDSEKNVVRILHNKNINIENLA